MGPAEPLQYDNLKLIRPFSGYKAEHWFILTHGSLSVAMVRHMPALVVATLHALDATR
jgi:hypothetical protein